MKALNCNRIALLVLLFIVGTGLYAQDAKKEFHEEFDTNRNTVLNIESRFSDLTINTWDKDKVVFDVTVEIDHSDKDKAKKLLNKIEISIEKDGNEINFESSVNDNLSKIKIGTNNKFTITIVANVPSSIALYLETKFGTTKIDEFSGDIDLEMSFGTMEIEQLDGSDISLTAKHGELSIGMLSDADVEMSFGSVHIHEAEDLDVEVNQGKLTIGSVNNLSAEVHMGSCDVYLVRPSFESIDIELSMGNVNLGIDRTSGFSIEGEMKMGGMDIPGEIGTTYQNKHNTGSSMEGKYGNGNSMISIEGNLGNIKLELK